MMQAKCQSCGDPIASRRKLGCYLIKKQKEAYEQLSITHCDACAFEKATGVLASFTIQNGTGGGQRVIRSTRGLS
jgi:hypothetical protein